jgi:hypothetical protein
MTINLIGYGLAVAVMLLVILRPAMLPPAWFFFGPMHAMSLFSYESNEKSVSLPLSLVLSALWWLRGIGMLNSRRLDNSALWLILFVFSCVSATCYAFLAPPLPYTNLASGSLVVESGEVNIPAIFRLIALVVHLGATLIAATWLCRWNALERAIQWVVYGCVFAASWGCMQVLLGIVGLDYPSFIFNTNASIGAQGFTGSANIPFIGTVPRMSSVSFEASLFAQACGIGFVLLLSSPQRRNGYWTQTNSGIFMMALLGAACIFSLSITGVLLVGYAAIVLMWRQCLQFREIRVFQLAFLILLGGLAVLLITTHPLNPHDLPSDLTAKQYSLMERLSSLHTGFSAFLQRPLLGNGFAALTVHDTVINLAANCGLLGLFCFLMFIARIESGLRSLAVRRSPSGIGRDLYLAWGWVILCLMLTGFSYHVLHLWNLIALTIAAITMAAARCRFYAFLCCDVGGRMGLLVVGVVVPSYSGKQRIPTDAA